MAKIQFTGFVEDWTQNSPQHPDWAMKTAEPHRKRDGDTWTTTARTFRTVKAGYENDQPVSIDFTQFRKGDRVTVTGTELTEVREANGKKYYDVVVKATQVVLAEGQQPRGAANGAGSGNHTNPAWNGPENGAQPQGDVWAAGGFTETAPF